MPQPTDRPDEAAIFAVTIDTDTTTAAILNELLVAHELIATAWDDAETRHTVLTIYTDTEAEAETVATRVTSVIACHRALLPGSTEGPAIRALARQDWAESWKAFFHPQRVSQRLTIKPSWEDYLPASPDECIIELDPGMSFGTGQHGTTQACLQYIDELSLIHPGAAFLDAGCGSGILSIAAARLGLSRVTAIDNDPAAVAAARENIELAGGGIELCEGTAGLWQPEQPFDIVAANILADVLVTIAPELVTYTAADGHLILSGILTGQFDDVGATYAALGWQCIDRRTIDEWTSGLFRAGRAPETAEG
ncbi:MAG: 50S ribosomal protein L11 methyltransferase [Lentisphaeria bacterium]|nr:50S ribosomal protein L11 methyltransferase [Lentisphaeria bacterium]